MLGKKNLIELHKGAVLNRSPRGVVVKVLDCKIIVKKFKFQSRYSDKYFWKRYELPYPTETAVKAIIIEKLRSSLTPLNNCSSKLMALALNNP